MESRSEKFLSKSRGKVQQSNMNGDDFSMPLPEELVERILAMVPFPQIFKARVLSKSWHARLSSTSSHDDEEKKLLAVNFQKRVSEWSGKWKTFSPVFLFDKFLMAYDCGSQHWRTISTLSVLSYREPMSVMVDILRDSVFFSSIVGALLLIRASPCSTDDLFVMNIFTGSWKKLPACPRIKRWGGTPARLVSSEESYKVITLSFDVGCASAWIYDNKLCAWRSQIFKAPEVRYFRVGWFNVYLIGVLYVLVFVGLKIWGFLAFDVKDETVNLLQMPHTHFIPNYVGDFVNPVPCNGALYIVVPEGVSVQDCPWVSTTVTLLEVDLVSRRWLKVTRGPPVALKFGAFLNKASSDGDCLFFEGQLTNERLWENLGKSSGKILAYNVRKDEWSVFAMEPIPSKFLPTFSHNIFDFDPSFQPGINPFLEV